MVVRRKKGKDGKEEGRKTGEEGERSKKLDLVAWREKGRKKKERGEEEKMYLVLTLILRFLGFSTLRCKKPSEKKESHVERCR